MIRRDTHNTKNTLTHPHNSGGFTLIELMVTSGIFITITLIIVGAVISLELASRKARATRVAFDNVGAAIDSMSRGLRMGSSFHCDVLGTPPLITQPNDCLMGSTGTGGATSIVFESQNGDSGNSGDQVVYRLNTSRIERSIDGGANYVALTAPEIRITRLKFWVGGTEVAENQPYVTMLVGGIASTSAKTFTDFNIQTTVSRRTPNLF